MTAPAKRQKQKHPPLVSIRAIREAYGLSPADLVQRIAEQGHHVSNQSTIRGVENGTYRPGNELMIAWAKALRLNPTDVILPENGNGDEAAA